MLSCVVKTAVTLLLLSAGFSSYIREPADKMRFFEAYTDITGSGKKDTLKGGVGKRMK